MSTFTADAAAALDGPEWLRARRKAAATRFAAARLPTEDEEDWRYSAISDLDLDRYKPASGLTDSAEFPPSVQRVLDSVGDRSGSIVTIDGKVARVEVAEREAAAGVTVGSGEEFETAAAVDAFVELHYAFAVDPIVLEVPRGVAVERPFVVVHWISGGGVAAFPDLTVRAGESSEITVVEHVASDAGDAFVAPITRLDATAASNVRHVLVQELGARSWQTGYLLASTGRDATVRSWVVALGGGYARLWVDASLTAAGGSAEIRAVYFGDGEQVLDFRSVQRHDAPQGRSDFFLKGAVADTARGIYTGVIRVGKGARGTDAFLTNRNLVLSSGAHVDSVPNLEIVNENDLRNCGHAAATGPVDEEHLFYLESRGIPTEVARRLVVLGFFDEVLATIPVAGLRGSLHESVAAKLDKATGA